MSNKSYDYKVIITFDLSYSKSPDYRLINSYLDEKGFKALTSSGDGLPSNTFTGVVSIHLELAGNSPTFAELKSGADKATRNTYESIRKSAEQAGIVITLFVQASLALVTSSRCSRT